jgi:class 3 adenylate cyclase
MAVPQALCPILVGRDPQLSILEDSLLAAVRGDAGVVVLGGEAGMGKSRLTAELMARAERLGCAVMFGACSEAELALPYLPFLEAIGNHLSTVDVAVLRGRLDGAAEELGQLFPQFGRGETHGLDPTQSKLRLFEAIVVLLREVARERGLLLVLEDLHWADPATRELLDYIARRLRATKVLVLATYRSDELHRKHPLLPTIQGWRRSGQVQVVELPSLTPEALAAMVCAIFDEPRISDEFRDFLHGRSEGNPFVVEEILKDALDRGDIWRGEGTWDRKSVAELRVPRTVKDGILLRLERLGPDIAEVISSASVIGRAFDLRTLTALTGREQPLVLGALQSSVLNQLLEEDDRAAGTYRFRHALTREAVYEDMVVPMRQQLHSRLADILAGQPGHAVVELAHHLLMAGRYDEAAPACIAAAEEATHALAFGDAITLYERALPHIRDRVEHARILCRTGEAHWNNAQPRQARPLLEQGISELEQAGLVQEAASQRLLLGRCIWELMLPDQAGAEYERARQVLEASGPSEALAIAYVRLSGLAMFSDRYEESLQAAIRAGEIAQKVAARLPLAWSWNFRAGSEVGLGRVEEGFRHMEESYRLAREGGYYNQASNATYNAAWLAIHLGRGGLARDWLERSLRDQPGGRTAIWSVWLPWIEGLILVHEGSIGQAVAVLRTVAEMASQSGHEKMAWRSRVGLAQALAEADQGTEASQVLPPLSSRVESQDEVYDGTARIRTRLALADPAGALEAAHTISPPACNLASPLDAVADAARSEPDWLAAFLNATPILGQVEQSPRLAAARGWLALYQGQTEQAVSQLERAESTFRHEGLLLDAWHAGRGLAEAEVRLGRQAAAAERLQRIVHEAEVKGALLAARLARETAAALGITLPEPELARSEGTTGRQDAEPQAGIGERLVTVMFVDVRGYTAMTGEKPPQEMADKISTLYRWAGQEIERHHGRVTHHAGDAVMATFNVSGVRLDHALHALQAAIAIRDKATYAGLPVGAGIAVGAAIVGQLTESAAPTAIGETPNLAARLQTKADAGEIVLSEETHRRVREWLAEHGVEAGLVQLELKGFDHPVNAFRIAAPATVGLK